jgi:hypothetical protein
MINQNRQGLTIQAFRSELIRGRLNFSHQDLSNLDFTNAIDLLDDKILILNGIVNRGPLDTRSPVVRGAEFGNH